MNYWPWWLGAIALSGASLAYWLLARRLIGVSGLFNQALDHKRQRVLAREQKASDEPAHHGLHWTTSMTFLVMLIVGGVVAAFSQGSLAVTDSMGTDFHRYFGSGASAYAVLLVGGVFVGFGARLGGG